MRRKQDIYIRMLRGICRMFITPLVLIGEEQDLTDFVIIRVIATRTIQQAGFCLQEQGFLML